MNPAVPLASVFWGLHQEVQGDDHDGHEEGSVPHLRRRWRISRWWGRRVNFHGQLHAYPRKKDTNEHNELWTRLLTRHDIVMVFQLRSCFGVDWSIKSQLASFLVPYVPLTWSPLAVPSTEIQVPDQGPEGSVAVHLLQFHFTHQGSQGAIHRLQTQGGNQGSTNVLQERSQ